MFAIFLIAAIFLSSNLVESSLPCKFIETVNITGGYKDWNENFIHKGDVYPLGTYQEFNYVENYANEKMTVDLHFRGCICKLKPCIRLCCRDNEIEKNIPDCFDKNTFTVENEDGDFETIFIDENKYGLLVGRPCKSIYVLDADYEEDHWRLLSNGSLFVNSEAKNTDEYCLAPLNGSNVLAYMCYYEKDDARFIVYPIGMLISIPFLIVTFLVHAWIPELRNLHGKCLMCYTFALAVLFISLSLVQAKFFNIQLDHPACTSLGYLIYLAVFLSFFWMNVMCFDIWSMARQVIINQTLKEEHKTFSLYCLYAFGVPFLITIFVVLIDFYEIFDEEYLPLFGSHKCYIRHSHKVEAIYIYIPMSIIIILNIIFFVDTARIIWKSQNATNDEHLLKRKKILRNRFSMYLRLFVIMGMTWCMESLSWFFNNTHTLFLISDFVNCILGLLIFLICVCNRRSRQLIKRRCCSSNLLNNESDDTYTDEHGITNETMKMSES